MNTERIEKDGIIIREFLEEVQTIPDILIYPAIGSTHERDQAIQHIINY